MADNLNASNPSESSPKEPLWTPFTHPGRGKTSKIYEYCVEKDEGERCVWVCKRRGRAMFAQDIKPSVDSENGTWHLRRDGWLKRLLFYGTVGVRKIAINFRSSEQGEHGFEVLWRSEDSPTQMQSLRQLLEKDCDMIPGECGVDIKGKRHEDGIQCANSYFDECNNVICKVKERRDLAIEIEALALLPTFLDYFWRNGFDEEGIKLLETEGLIWSYRYCHQSSESISQKRILNNVDSSALREDRWTDAELPFGKTVAALELIQGWRTIRLFVTILMAVVLDTCIVGATTYAFKSLQTGLAAGSYATGLEALLITLLTLLSFILP